MIGETYHRSILFSNCSQSCISLAQGNAIRNPTFCLQLCSNPESVNQAKINFLFMLAALRTNAVIRNNGW